MVAIAPTAKLSTMVASAESLSASATLMRGICDAHTPMLTPVTQNTRFAARRAATGRMWTTVPDRGSVRVGVERLPDDPPTLVQPGEGQIVGEVAGRDRALHFGEGGGGARAIDRHHPVVARQVATLWRGARLHPVEPCLAGQDRQRAVGGDAAQVRGLVEGG